jgi:hypothetical protein
VASAVPSESQLEQERLIGKGLTSEVFSWGEDRVLKLNLAWVPATTAQREFAVTRAVHAAGVNVPAVFELVQVGERHGIVFERVHGPSMVNEVEKRPWTLFGAVHNDLPHVVADRPVQYWDVPEGERDSRIILTEDTCEIDNEHFFVRGVIEIPVHDYAPGFGFGVWVSHKRENYQTYLNNPDSADIGPFFGWLCTIIKFYERDTQLLKTMAHYRGNGLRPSIVLEPESDHPLALDQREGITLEKAWQIVHSYDNQ